MGFYKGKGCWGYCLFQEIGMETPGMMLKREREARGLTIKYIAAETKISETSLVAIENNEFEAFAAEVFVRGFLRNYARALSLSAEEVISSYEAFKNQSAQCVEPATELARDTVREATAANTNEERTSSVPNFRFAYLVVALIMVASIALSVAMTGTGEAGESDGQFPQIDQDVDESPFLVSNPQEGWNLK